jgi:hypothetical protein
MKQQHKQPTKKKAASKKVPSIGTRGRLGLDWGLIVSLGAVGAVRPLVHDLPTFADAKVLQGVVAVAVFLIILIVPLLMKVPRPLATLICIGGVYGLLSVIVHQLMWTTVFPDGYPPLGLDATYQPPELVLRVFASVATLITSILTGGVLGLLALGISKRTYPKAMTGR